MIARPCLACGSPTSPGPRCNECATRTNRIRTPRKHTRPTSPESRGYDRRWRDLSLKVRRLQPFCSDCGATDDLQADHSPEAWKRVEKGLPLRVQDVDVVCGRCNRERGAARGSGATRRSRPLEAQE